MTNRRIGGIELGGTKGVALVAEGRTILARHQVPTTTPAETLGALNGWLQAQHAADALAAVGIASFGPLALHPDAPDFGQITTTPKPGWAGAAVRAATAAWFAGPIGFDTDVNGAARAEWCWGAGQGQSVIVYLTIGTGVGGGVLVNGLPVHGQVHPEMGHLRIRRVSGDLFPGVCTFHGDCIEGLVAGPALAARTGQAGETLGPDHPVWALVAQDLGELMTTLCLTLSPTRILLGGGVGMGQPALLAAIRDATAARLNGYIAGVDRAALDRMIVQPMLGTDAGPLGAVALGQMAYDKNTNV